LQDVDDKYDRMKVRGAGAPVLGLPPRRATGCAASCREGFPEGAPSCGLEAAFGLSKNHRGTGVPRWPGQRCV